MANKKRKKKPAKSLEGMANPLAMLAGRSNQVDTVSQRVNGVIQAMSKPETLLEHLQRTGADYWSATSSVDANGNPFDKACLVIPWESLITAELAHIQAGGKFAEQYGAYGEQKIHRVQGRKYGKSPMGGSGVSDLMKGIGGLGEAAKKISQGVREAQQRREQKVMEEADAEIIDAPPKIHRIPVVKKDTVGRHALPDDEPDLGHIQG